MTQGNRVILGLGSNLGDREQHLRRAVTAITKLLENVTCSTVYESHALLPNDAPSTWDMAFLNIAVCGETDIEPRALLEQVKEIEHKLGRTPRGRWGPREIDIDILAYGSHVMAEPTLIIPHRELLTRDFALIPLADVAPDWIHPLPGGEGAPASELAARMKSTLKKTDIVIP
jgi:2-amino-4-hydroxy-6-hydroxymethyldihydropteridine diphosphokinase